jgi:hypothetical protein
MKTTKELEAELEYLKELHRKEPCKNDIINVSFIEGQLFDRKETHFDEMVEYFKRAYELVLAESRFPDNIVAMNLEKDMRELLAKLEGKK